MLPILALIVIESTTAEVLTLATATVALVKLSLDTAKAARELLKKDGS